MNAPPASYSSLVFFFFFLFLLLLLLAPSFSPLPSLSIHRFVLPVRRIDSRCIRLVFDPNSLVHRPRWRPLLEALASMVCASRSMDTRRGRSRACDARGLINCTLGTGPPFGFDPGTPVLNLPKLLSRVFVISVTSTPFVQPPFFFSPAVRATFRDYLSRFSQPRRTEEGHCRSPVSSDEVSTFDVPFVRSVREAESIARQSQRSIPSRRGVGGRGRLVSSSRSNRRSARLHSLVKARRTSRVNAPGGKSDGKAALATEAGRSRVNVSQFPTVTRMGGREVVRGLKMLPSTESCSVN